MQVGVRMWKGEWERGGLWPCPPGKSCFTEEAFCGVWLCSFLGTRRKGRGRDGASLGEWREVGRGSSTAVGARTEDGAAVAGPQAAGLSGAADLIWETEELRCRVGLGMSASGMPKKPGVLLLGVYFPSFLTAFCPSTGQARCSWSAWLPRTPGSQGAVISHFCPTSVPSSLISDPWKHRLAECGVP